MNSFGIKRGLLVLLLGLMTACTRGQVGHHRVIWHDGQCLLYVDGLSAEKVKELAKSWEFKECEVVADKHSN